MLLFVFLAFILIVMFHDSVLIHCMLCSMLMSSASSGVPSSLAVDYSEYFPVSSFKPHRRLILIKTVAKLSSKLNCILSQNLQNSQECRVFAMADHTISYQGPFGCQKRLNHSYPSSVHPSTKVSNQPGM